MEQEMQKNSTEKEAKKIDDENLPFFKKVSKFRTYITVEPLLACYVMPSVLASLAVQNLNLEKACRVNKNFGEEICDRLIQQNTTNETFQEEREVQAEVAYMTAWRLPLQTALPAIIILFVGAWSDKTGRRKPCMLIPMIGEFSTALGLMLCTYYFLEWPLEVAGVIEGLPPALTGGWATMFMAIFSYLADNTTPEDRTFRIGIVNAFISIAVPVGTALSGIMLKQLGFYGVFGVCLGIYIVGFIYGIISIKDRRVEKFEGDKNCCVELLNVRYVYDTFMVLFRPRRNGRRLRTILLITVYILVAGPVHGSGALAYLYARIHFKFNEVDFSYFSSYSILLNLIGVMLALTLFSKYLKMDDSLIAVMACISKVLASFVYAFAPNKNWVYLAPVVEFIGGTAVIAMRSIATKVVEPDEIGKMNSLFGVCDAFVNSIYGPIFATFYVKTSPYFPGAYCLLSALLTSPTIFIFLYMYVLQKRETKLELEKEKDGANNIAFENEVTAL